MDTFIFYIHGMFDEVVMEKTDLCSAKTFVNMTVINKLYTM